jgi:2-aminoethylphosphonate-pyruvate transaminase
MSALVQQAGRFARTLSIRSSSVAGRVARNSSLFRASTATAAATATVPAFPASVTVTRVSTRTPCVTISSQYSMSSSSISGRDGQRPTQKLLFTPGPLLSSQTVKAAMLEDYGSRDIAFINKVKEVRSGVLELAEVSPDEYTMIPMQGSGTFGVEAVVSSVVPKDGGLLVVANGAYGQRIEKMAQAYGIHHKTLLYADDTKLSLEDIDAALKADSKLTHVACVHSETTSGIMNDVESVGKLVHEHKRSFIVDAMSSFGAMPLDMAAGHIDYMVSSANKCIQGVPGFALIVARKSCLAATQGNARTLSLNVHDQLRGLDGDGQFRFTPPTHTLAAFHTALQELKAEGGWKARHQRYQENCDIVDKGMKEMGFKRYLKDEDQGPVISSWKYPNDPNWNFETFYSKLNERDLVIYPGKVTNADCFRIGHIGHLFPADSHRLVDAMKEVAQEMGFDPAA